MFNQTKIVQSYTKPDGYCESSWGKNKCPNKAKFIIRCIGNNGLAIMCEVHKNDYKRYNRYKDITYLVEDYSLELAMKYIDVLEKYGPYGKIDN